MIPVKTILEHFQHKLNVREQFLFKIEICKPVILR